MTKFDVTILTDARYVRPTVITPYIQNVLDEDRIVQEALEKIGLRVTRVDWADADFDWSSTKVALFRSTWDYFERYTEFTAWLERVEGIVAFVNPIEMIRWNLDKHYLQDLEGRGVNITETLFIEVGDHSSLTEHITSTGWEDVILKPAFSAAARHTYRLSKENLLEHEAIFSQLIKEESMLLQPFQKSIEERGEVSLMYFGGIYSHATLKIAKPGDFRVQDDFGGTVHDYLPTNDELELADKALNACSSMPIYSRVDIIEDNSGHPALSELELIEPELWIRMCPEAAPKLADTLNRYLQDL